MSKSLTEQTDALLIEADKNLRKAIETISRTKNKPRAQMVINDIVESQWKLDDARARIENG